MHFVVDVGSKQIKAGLFEGNQLLHTIVTLKQDDLLKFLKDKKIEKGLISSRDSAKGLDVMTLLSTEGYGSHLLNIEDFKQLGMDLQPDRIANIFGALYYFPLNDCVIVDIGTQVRFDYVTKQGIYLGGAVFPDFDTVFSSLEKTPFPDLGGQTPLSLGKTALEQSKSGCYFGVLGAIERILAELRLSSETPSDVMTVATGGITLAIQKDLDFIDRVDPHLTLIGLNEILKEGKP